MTTEGEPHATGRGVRLFDLLLRLLVVLLALVTIASAVLGVAMLAGTGASLAVPAEVEPPYSVELDGASVDVDEAGDSHLEFDRGTGSSFLTSVDVGTRIYIGKGDTDTRLVLLAAGAACLALAWLGLVNLRRVVRSARRGDPFDERNVARLRWLAAVVISFPVLAVSVSWLVQKSVDLGPRVEVATWGPSWWVFPAIAVGFLALAEVFRAGSELRELERSTI
jgi:Protein of unknown function (DUF2975)